MSNTAWIVIGGAAVAGFILWQRQGPNYPGSVPGAAASRTSTVQDVLKLGTAIAQVGGRIMSNLDKVNAARAQGGYATTGSTSDNQSGTGNDIFAIGTG